jgi:hypothetical protein
MRCLLGGWCVRRERRTFVFGYVLHRVNQNPGVLSDVVPVGVNVVVLIVISAG